MNQKLSPIPARTPGRTLFVLGVIAMLATGSRATSQNPGLPKIHARKIKNGRTGSFRGLLAARNWAAANGDENVPKTFVDMSPAELAEAVPELKELKLADSQEPLPQILERGGSAVASFFNDFSDTVCTEYVTSVVHKQLHKKALHFDNRYNYMAVSEPGATKWTLREYRTDEGGELVDTGGKSGIVTFGFVALVINLHPDFQADSRFRYLGREEMEKESTYVIAFAQRPKVARQPASVRYVDRHGVVYLQGIAWIDPVNFRIVRLRTDIEQPELNVGLQKETTEVVYSEVNFEHTGKTLWLPAEVTVNGQLLDYSFHNEHRYSGYRVFNVQVEQKAAHPVP
jgi:hypothetical protein